jgi:c-di-GMP-binding flagellar brake protein YcgR
MSVDSLGMLARSLPGSLAGSRIYNIRRREPRYISSIPVAMQRFLRFGPVVTRGVTLDISMRGMSALVCGALRVGETVVIELPSRDEPVEMLATVRHNGDANSGFEFFPLSTLAEQEIQDWIERLSKQEETLFPYFYARAAK